MSKKIGVIAEDQSDVDVVSVLLEKYSPKNRFSIRKFIGNGCGRLRNKCTSWADTLISGGCEHVLLIHDRDRNDEQTLRAQLVAKLPAQRFPKSVVIIPVEELEAWLLADERALAQVFSMRKIPKRITNCEAVTSPKEAIGKIVWATEKKRYLNTVHNKKIAEKSSLGNLRRCRSYLTFDQYVTTQIFV